MQADDGAFLDGGARATGADHPHDQDSPPQQSRPAHGAAPACNRRRPSRARPACTERGAPPAAAARSRQPPANRRWIRARRRAQRERPLPARPSGRPPGTVEKAQSRPAASPGRASTALRSRATRALPGWRGTSTTARRTRSPPRRCRPAVAPGSPPRTSAGPSRRRRAAARAPPGAPRARDREGRRQAARRRRPGRRIGTPRCFGVAGGFVASGATASGTGWSVIAQVFCPPTLPERQHPRPA